MPDNQNVQIPMSLFRKISDFFICVSFGNYIFPAIYGFDDILAQLRAKQDKINLRTAYTNSILAKDEQHKMQAYANYQKLKNNR
jgi:hypothetical protein